jgi:CRP-like cAMP-binding protein
VALSTDIIQNNLLASLGEDGGSKWHSSLEKVELPNGLILYEPGLLQKYVYFPTTAIVSLLYELEDGASVDIAVVGNEGMVGVSLFMGDGSTPGSAVVHSAGSGYRLGANALLEEFNLGGAAMRLLLRYTQALITQMAQTAACNKHHTLDKKLCRWLLLTLDRIQGAELHMTHELIANILGVRREGVTEAALKLQSAGVIRYTRGRITVIDRVALEHRACECYEVVRKEYQRLLPQRQSKWLLKTLANTSLTAAEVILSNADHL